MEISVHPRTLTANYSPTLKKEQCSDEMAMPEVNFVLVVGIKDNDCSLCISRLLVRQ